MVHQKIRTVMFLGIMVGWLCAEARPSEEAPNVPNADQKKPITHELVVSPAAQPTPLLRYRLLPLDSELNPGDAVPVYLRASTELRSPTLSEVQEEATKLLRVPLGEFPKDQAQKLIERWGGRLEQIALAARRRTCEWNYPLNEQREDVIQILLPDASELRGWARLLGLKARLQILEGDFSAAMRTLETGMSMGRHAAEGPFIINALVGAAIHDQMLTHFEELISQPNAPNLYWALTTLPQPLLSVRRGLETEQKIGEWMVPALEEATRSHSAAEWRLLLERLHVQLRRLERILASSGDVKQGQAEMVPPTIEEFTKQVLPVARAFFHNDPKLVGDRERSTTDGPSDAEWIARFFVRAYLERRDDMFKLTALPYREAVGFYPKSATEPIEPPALRMVLEGLLSTQQSISPVRKVHSRQSLLEQRIAVLRTVEALRLHAASHGGVLPKSLAEITEVPIPRNPLTSEPVNYRLEGSVGLLTSPAPEGMASDLELRYEIRMRDAVGR